MTIQRFTYTSREEWLKLRHHDVTGSEVGALFRMHRYLTPAKLYAEKIGALADKEESSVMKRGLRLEKFVADVLQERHPEWTITKATDYYRDTEHRIGGTPDYFITMPAPAAATQEFRGDITRILEIKTVGASDFKSIWRGGDPHGTIIPESWQLLQVQTYLHLTKADDAILAVMPIGEWDPLDVHEIPIPRSATMIKLIKSKVGTFWNDVNSGAEPEFDYSRDKDVIKALYASATPGSSLDMSFDNEMPELLDRREELKADEKKITEELSEVEGRLIQKIGDAETVILDGRVWESLTRKNQHNKGYTVEPFDFRVLRPKKVKTRY